MIEISKSRFNLDYIIAKPELQHDISEIAPNSKQAYYFIYPFRAGYFSVLRTPAVKDALCRVGMRTDLEMYGEPVTINNPLSNQQRLRILSKVGGCGDLSAIETYIKEDNPGIDAHTLTWKDIFRYVELAKAKAAIGDGDEPKDLMTLAEIQDKITIRKKLTLYRMIDTGRLKGYKKGGLWYVSKEEAIIKLALKDKYRN